MSKAAPGRTLQLLGVDPFSEAPFRPYLARGSGRGRARPLAALVTEPGAVLLSRETAGDLGVRAGDTLVLRVSGRERPVRVVALIEPENARSAQALRNLVVADVTTAQEVLDQPGRLSRVDLALPGGSRGRRRSWPACGRPCLRESRSWRPPARSEFVGELTHAFDVNLTALSLLALMVGLFLAYNTMTFSVVQRRATIGMLRALGVTRAEIVGVVLAEALLLGAGGDGPRAGRRDRRWPAGWCDSSPGRSTISTSSSSCVTSRCRRRLSPRARPSGSGRRCSRRSCRPPRPARRRPGRRSSGSRWRPARAGPRRGSRWRVCWCSSRARRSLAIAGRSLAWSYAGLFAMILGAALLTPLAMIGAARAAGPRARRASRPDGTHGGARRRREALAHRRGGGGAHGGGLGDRRRRRDDPQLPRDGRALARDLAGGRRVRVGAHPPVRARR